MASDLPGPEDIPLDPDLLKTLASDSRRDILRLLKQRRMTLTELATALELGKATVLEHLKKLQDANLIVRREDERLWVYYDLTPRGRRVVTPGRTRFYIVMGVTAAAALLVGVVLALAVTHAPPLERGSSPALQGAQPPVAEGTQVVWRGLSEGVSLQVSQGGRPAAGTLLVEGSPFATDANGTLSLDATALDALPAGNHTLAFLPREGTAREAVAGFLDVRDPAPAISPLQVPAGREAQVALALADPQAPLPATVLVDGQPLALQPQPGGATISLRAAAPGELHVQVGRLAPIAVEAVPDFALSLSPDGAGNLTLRVAAADGSPLSDARATLDGAPLGTTDANGTLRFAAPAPGVRTLALDSSGGQIARALRFEGWNVTEQPPGVSLSAIRPGVFAARVANAGPEPLSITLDALVDGRLAAAQALDVPAGSAVEAELAVASQPPGSHAGVLEARALARSPVTFTNGTAAAAGSTAGPPAAPTTTTPAATTPASATPTAPTTVESDTLPAPAFPVLAGDVLAQLPVGTVSFGPATPAAGSALGAPSPKVPGAEVALVLAAAAGLALLARRRRA